MIYLISDTHFDHENIIQYCDRPFASLQEMDSSMKELWNNRVGPSDVVLHGGDIAMARSEKVLEYVEELNGNLVLLDGNHDDINQSDASFPILKSHYFTYKYKGEEYEFYFTHWPVGTDEQYSKWPDYSEVPDWFDGWCLHGHTHNNNLDDFPFVNQENKSVNLSVEVAGYSPITIEELIGILNNGEQYSKISDVPEEDRPTVSTGFKY